MSAPPSPPADDLHLQTTDSAGASTPAFSDLVHRHIDLVYAAAYRQTRDAQLAEDITQAVFLLLWQRSPQLGGMMQGPCIGGWLLLATRHVAHNALRHEWRLKRRERKVAAMTPEQDSSPAPSPAPEHADEAALTPILDQAMAEMSATDRSALVERYFRDRPVAEVAAALGLTEAAAAKRITRALQRLKAILLRHGIHTTEAALGAALPAVALKPAAPAALAAAVAGGTAAASAGAKAALLARAARPLLRPWWTKPLIAMAATAATIAVAAAAVLALRTASPAHPAALAATPVIAAAPAPAPPPAPLAADDSPTITLNLIDPVTKHRLDGATVAVRSNGRRARPAPAPGGRFTFTFPQLYREVDFFCRCPGRVPMQMRFTQTEFTGKLLRNYTIPMPLGTRIGGIVTNDLGDPLPAASVRISSFFNGDLDAPQLGIDDTVTTDADGHWHYDLAPPSLGQLMIEIRFGRGKWLRPNMELPADQLRAGAFTQKLEEPAGHIITGIVLNPAGLPVNGAQVVVANDRYDNDKPTATTDATGHFRIAGVEDQPWDRHVTATFPGYGPEQVILHPDRYDQPLTITLSQPVAVEGTITTADNAPVAGATVEVENWRNNRALVLHTTTDSHGQFILHDAPPEPMQINVSHNGLATLQSIPITPGNPVHLKMYPPLHITGTVTDAQTHQLIHAFRISYGIRWGGQDDTTTWQMGQSLRDGHYTADLGMFSLGDQLRVEADGYLPAISRLLHGDEGNLTLNFALQRGHGPAGVVLNPDGTPAPNVQIVLGKPGWPLYLSEQTPDQLQQISDFSLARTDNAGRFQLKPQEDPKSDFWIAAFSDAGYANLTREQWQAAGGKIQLQAWGRIDLDLWMNNAPAAGMAVNVESRLPGYPFNADVSRTATTDDNGHCVIERVLPSSQVWINASMPGTQWYRQLGNCAVQPGETTHLHLGGFGRPVTCALALPPGLGDVDFNVQLQAVGDALLPKSAPAASPRRPLPPQMLAFNDHTLRGEDIPPGTYHLDVTATTPLSAATQGRLTTLGEAEMDFTVPATPACPNDQPLDIGTLTIKAKKP